jgi:hypothetical protein
MTTNVWVGPTIKETPAAFGRLFSRYGIDRGISLVQRQDTTYYLTRYPALSELEAALTYYLGGHEYVLSDAEVTSITAAGYGAYIQVRP